MLKLSFRYNCFGLKKEWVTLFFKEKLNFFYSSFLGPKQKDSLFYYLKDMELVKNKNQINEDIFYYFNSMFEKYNISYNIIWSILWINLNFNSNLFWFWNTLSKGKYKNHELLDMLVSIYGKSNKYVTYGLNSLISTFEHTPIGNELKIGIVQKEKKGRSVTKEGGFKFDPYVILYAIYKYAFKNNIYEIDIDKIEKEMFSPQNILVIDSKYIKNCLIELQYLDIFTIDIKENSYFKLYLKDIKSPYEIIRILFEKENI